MNTFVLEPLPSLDELDMIGAQWGLSDFCFIRKMENIVYSCRRNGQTVFLRLTSRLRREKNEILAELEWIDFLGNQGISVGHPIKSIQGT